MITDLSQLSDEQLWAHHTSGDSDAFEELIVRHRSKLRLYVETRAKNVSASIDDIIQDSILKMFQVGKKFDGKNFVGYLIRIANRKIIDQYRRQQKYSPSEWVEEIADDNAINGLALMAERETSQKKTIALRECLKIVDRTFVEVFLMKVQDELSGLEIAKRIGIPGGTVHSRTSRAKASLKECMEGKLS